MRYFPINFAVAGRRVVVVGGGRVAARKAEALLECGAEVIIISPEICADLEALAGPVLVRRDYRTGDLEGACLVISATDSEAVNAQVWEDANLLNLPVNVVDQPERCTFTVPAVMRQGDLMIAISTDGISPSLSGRIRRRLEHQFGSDYADHLALLRHMRDQVKASPLALDQRSALLKQFSDDRFRDRIRDLGIDMVRAEMQQMLEVMVEQHAGH
jgi:precorrin-2 dehydrogenase/sirohydrochlorin ferrochelatase